MRTAGLHRVLELELNLVQDKKLSLSIDALSTPPPTPPRAHATIKSYGHLSQLIPENRKCALFEEFSYILTIDPPADSNLSIETFDDEFFGESTRPSRQHSLRIYSFQLKGHIGHLPITVKLNNKDVLSLSIESFPTKIDYQRDFHRLLADLARLERSLPFHILSPTHHNFSLGPEPASRTDAEWLAVLRWKTPELRRALHSIQSSPHSELRREATIRPAALVRRASTQTAAWLARHPQHCDPNNRRPLQLRDERRLSTRDNAENRYIKACLASWSVRLQKILEQNPRLEPGLATLSSELRSQLNSELFSELKGSPRPNSQVLLHRGDYRSVLRIDEALRRPTQAKPGPIPMTLKHLPLLYEYWVLLSIHEILCEELGFQCDQAGPGLNPELHSGYKLQSQGQLQYQGPDGASARLIYQGLFRSLDDPDRDDSDEDPGSEKLDEALQSETARQVPDGLLCLDLASCDSTLRIILDAKYRLEPDGGPRNSDINTMHRYRDAILLRNEQNEWLHAITQAWFIYPGSPDESLSTKKGLDRQKKYLQSAKSIGIGAIPALPGHREELAINLQRVLNSSRAQLESSRPRTTHRQSIPLPARQPQCLLVFFDQENELNSQFHQGLIQLEDNSLELSNNLAFVLLCLRQNPINQESYYSAHSLHEARLLPKPHKPSIRLGHSIEIEGSSIFRDQAPEKFQVQPFSRVLRNLGKALK